MVLAVELIVPANHLCLRHIRHPRQRRARIVFLHRIRCADAIRRNANITTFGKLVTVTSEVIDLEKTSRRDLIRHRDFLTAFAGDGHRLSRACGLRASTRGHGDIPACRRGRRWNGPSCLGAALGKVLIVGLDSRVCSCKRQRQLRGQHGEEAILAKGRRARSASDDLVARIDSQRRPHHQIASLPVSSLACQLFVSVLEKRVALVMTYLSFRQMVCCASRYSCANCATKVNFPTEDGILTFAQAPTTRRCQVVRPVAQVDAHSLLKSLSR